MRVLPLIHGLLTGLLLVACGKDDGGATDGSSDTDTSGSSSDAAPVTTTDPSAGSNSGGNACIPGMSVACTCTDGRQGAQVCAADGQSFGPCACQGGTASASDATSTTSTTSDDTTGPLTSSTTSDDTTSDDTTSTTSTTTGAPVCEDPGPEPNEDEASAVDLGNQTCTARDGSIVGVLDGATDSDWSRFRGVDGMGCGFSPFVVLSLTASDALRLCVYADCLNGNTEFNCSMGSMAATSPEGLAGCCAAGDITLSQFNCTGTQNESADFFVRLDRAPEDACVEYSVSYSYGPL